MLLDEQIMIVSKHLGHACILTAELREAGSMQRATLLLLAFCATAIHTTRKTLRGSWILRMGNPECIDHCPLKKRCPKQLLFAKFQAFEGDKRRKLSKRPENSHKFYDGQVPPAVDAHRFVVGSLLDAIRGACDGPVPLRQKRPWTKYVGLGNVLKVCGADPQAIHRASDMIDSARKGTTDSDPNFSDSVDSGMNNEGKILIARRIPDGLGAMAIADVREFPLYLLIQTEQNKDFPEWPLLQDS